MPSHRFLPGNPGGPGRPKGPDKITAEAREFLRSLTSDPEYRDNLRKALRERRVAPQLEIFIWAHVAGQPKLRHEITGANDGPIGVSVVPVAQLTDAQLAVLEQVLQASTKVIDVLPAHEPEKVQ